jgi:hypothetical protein
MAPMVVVVFSVASAPCRNGGCQNAARRVTSHTSHNDALARVFCSVKIYIIL